MPVKDTRTLPEKLEAYTDRSGGPDACWPWTGCRDLHGYGIMRWRPAGRKNVRAHRMAWEDANGPVPVELRVLHRCDNPPCCNPAHLFLGTMKDNTQDMMAKGRHRIGERRTKLTLDQVRAIREADVSTYGAQAALARAYGVNGSTISNIRSRRLYPDV